MTNTEKKNKLDWCELAWSILAEHGTNCCLKTTCNKCVALYAKFPKLSAATKDTRKNLIQEADKLREYILA